MTGTSSTVDAMVIGICTIRLMMPENHSLKEKRGTIKSILAKVKNRFNVSISEVGQQDAWQTATLGVALISTEAGHADRVLAKVVEFIESGWPDIQLLDYDVEIL
jgi:uncharacterized protein YlxP (DUF503 family)